MCVKIKHNLKQRHKGGIMDIKVLLDVAMPAPGPVEAVVGGIHWIIVFIIVAFAIAIVSVIVVRKGVKKAKKEVELRTLAEQLPAEDADTQQNL